MKIYVAHTKDFEYKDKLYLPLRHSPLNKEHEIILHHEGEGNTFSREIIKGCDLLLAEVSMPSISLGVEIGWANAFGVLIITLHEKSAKKPWWADEVCKADIEYTDPA